MAIPENIIINWSEWLKKILTWIGLDNIQVPFFDQIINLSKKELEELKSKIQGKILEWKALSDAIKEIIDEKLEWIKNTQESTVTWLASEKTVLLKETVSKWKNHITSQINTIKSIDITKKVSEIPWDSINTYKAWLVLLIQQLAASWIKKEDLSDISKLKEIAWKQSFDTTMQEVLNKTLEILNNPKSELNSNIALNWNKIVDMAYVNAPSIKEASESIALWKLIPDWNFIWDLSKKYPQTFTFLTIAGAIWILWVAWKMFFGWSNNKKWLEEWTKDKGWFFSWLFDKFKWWILWWAWLLWVVWLWKMVWIENIVKYAKDNLGIDISENKFQKIIECFQKWEYMMAIKILIFWSDQLEKAKESEEFYKGVVTDMHERWYTKDLRSWQETKYIKDYAWWNTKTFLDWFKSWIDIWIWIFWWDTEDFLHKSSLREYISKETKRLNIDIKAEDKVEYTLKMIIEKNKPQSKNWETTWSQKTEKPQEVTEKPWESNLWVAESVVAWWAAAWLAVAWSDISLGSEKTPQKEDPSKEDWVEYSSLDNPVLYYWVKWKRLSIWKAQISSWLRRYIEQLEWNIGWLPETRQEVRDMKKIESLLNSKKTLWDSDKKILVWLLDIHMEKFTKIPVSAKTYLDILENNPDLKKELLDEQKIIRENAEKYHDDMNKLVKEKYETIKKWEIELRKLTEKWWFSIKDYIDFKSPLTSRTSDWSWKIQSPIESVKNRFSDYSRMQKLIMWEVAALDQKMADLNTKFWKTSSSSIKWINDLVEKHHIKPEEKIWVKENFFKSLEKVGYTINSIPWAWIWRLWFRVWFTWIVAWTLADERARWDENFKDDLTEVWLWLLPITSEILDFKAAFSWYDMAWRDLTTKDRWIRAWFWVVWTVADLATVISFWQSEWLRVRLAWAKWTTKIAELAWKIWWTDKIKDALFAFSRWESFVWLEKSEKVLKYIKWAGKTWRIVNYWALWIATYQVATEIDAVDFLPDWKIYESWKNIVWKLKDDAMSLKK